MIPQIRTLQAVVSCQSISKGAATRSISPAAAVHQLHHLEKEVGCELFAISGDRLELTEAGIYFYRKTASLIQDFDKIAEKTCFIAQQEEEVLRVGFDNLLFEPLLQKTAGRFQEAFPSQPVRLFHEESDVVWDQVRHNQTDLALLRHRPDISAQYHIIPALRTRLVVELSEHHPLAGQKKIDISQLNQYPCVICLPQARDTTSAGWFLEKEKISSPVRFLFSPAGLSRMLEETGGYALQEVSTHLPSGSRLIPLFRENLPVQNSYSLIWKKANEKKINLDFARLLNEQLKTF